MNRIRLACAVFGFWATGWMGVWAALLPGGEVEWLVFGKPQAALDARVQNIERLDDGVRISTRLAGAWLERGVGGGALAGGASPMGVAPDAERFDLLTVPGLTHVHEVGMPRLPAQIHMVDIPHGVEPVVRFVAIEQAHVKDVRIVPAQALPPDVYPAPPPEPFAKDVSVYERHTLYPPDPVAVASVVDIRDRRVLRLVVVPATFDAGDSSVEVVYDYRVEVSWEALAAIEPPADSSALPIYMILTPDRYATNAALMALADWKKQKGLDVRVVRTSQINASGAPSHADIVAHMRALPQADYPDYLLIAGPHTPTNGVAGAYFNTHTADYFGYTDLDIACRTDSDFFPDLYCGRMPANSQEELTAMVSKALAMDRAPPASGIYRRVVVAGQIQDSDNGGDNVADRLFCETADCIARYFEAQTGGISYSSVRAIVNPNGMTADGLWNSSSLLWNSTDVIGSRIHTQFVSVAEAQSRISAWANAGAAIVQHRDHGYVNGVGWGDPLYLYSHVAALTNGANQGVVFSINCNSGMYNFTNNFARAWLAKPNGGAYAVFAPVDTSYSWLNDWLTHGFYAGFLPDYLSGQNASAQPAWPKKLPAPSGTYGAAGSARKLGHILNFGKFYMAEKFWLDEDTFRLFHLFGDPESELRLIEPATNTVGHPSAIQMSAASVTVTVSQAASSICLYSPSLSVQAVASPVGGRAVFPLTLDESGTLQVTVTGPGLRPYEGTIQVVRSGQPFSFTALPLAGSVMLRWSNPLESGFGSQQVRIRADTQGYPESPDSGRAVYAGDALQFLDETVTNRIPYYYTLFVTDDGETFFEP